MAKSARPSVQVWGFIDYQLIGDGSLNGRWTNNFLQAQEIRNEIARKVDGPRDSIQGIYNVAWLEEDTEPAVIAILRIEAIRRGGWFTLEWKVDGNVAFRGAARLIGPTNLSAIYWDGDSLTLPFVTP